MSEAEAAPSVDSLIEFMQANFMSLSQTDKIAVLKIARQASILDRKNYLAQVPNGVMLDLSLIAEESIEDLINMVNLVRYKKDAVWLE